MTCKDCVHFDACNFIMQRYTDLEGLNPNGCDCSNFADKSLFIELPCKAGDKVYTVIECENTFIEEGYVASVAVEHGGGIEIYVRYESGLTYWYWVEDIGKRFFLTYEEAEKALKERKK